MNLLHEFCEDADGETLQWLDRVALNLDTNTLEVVLPVDLAFRWLVLVDVQQFRSVAAPIAIGKRGDY